MSSQTTSYRGLLPLSLVVAMLAMLAPFTIDTYLPSFPDIATHLVATPLQMQQTISLYLLAFAVSTLLYGPLSDSLGRKRVVLGALVIYVVSSVGCAIAMNIEQLILMRIGQGIAASAGLVIGRAMIRDCYEGAQAQRVMARMMLLFAIAPAFAPLIGGWLQQWLGWRSVFWFLAVLGLLLVLFVVWGSSETHPRERRQRLHPGVIGRAYWGTLRHRRFLGLAFTFALAFGGFFIYVAGAPAIIYQHLKMGANDFWLLFVPLVGGIIIGSHLAERLAGRATPYRIVSIGFAVMLLAALLNVLQAILWPATPFGMIAPAALYITGMAITMPNLSLMGMACFPENRGTASAMQSFIQVALTALVTGVVVPLVMSSVTAIAWAMLLLCSGGLLVWTGVRLDRAGVGREN